MAEHDKWILINKYTKATFVLNKPLIKVGRSRSADLKCYCSVVSINHAFFHIREDGSLYVEDMASQNGIYINEERLPHNGSQDLKPGDEVGLGYSWKSFHEDLNKEFINVNQLYYIFEVQRQPEGTDNDTKDGILIKIDPDLENICDNIETEYKRIDGNFKIEIEEHNLSSENKGDEDIKPIFNDVGYSACKQLVEISDDDDLMSHSKLTKPIKREPSENIEDNTYIRIKQELEEMDRLDGSPNPIALVENHDYDSDWMNSPIRDEEPSQSPNSCNNNPFDALSDTNSPMTYDNNEERPSTSSRNNHVSPSVSSIPEERTSTKIKEARLPIKRTKKDEQDTNKTFSKYNKQTRIQKIDETTHSFATALAGNDTKKRMVKVRNVKSQIPKTKKTAAPSTSIPTPKLSGTARVKLTVNRGAYLLEEQSRAPKRVNPIANKSPNSETPNNEKENTSESIMHSAALAVHLDPTLDPILSSIDVAPLLAVPSAPILTEAVVEPPVPEPVHEPVFEPELEPEPSAAIATNALNVNVDDIINLVLQWTTSWFKEQDKKLAPPPLHKKPLQIIPEVFQNYQQYYDVFQPLLLLELWASLYHSWAAVQKRDSHICKIIRQCANADHHETIVKTYLTRPQFEAAVIKQDDITILEVPIEYNGRSSYCALFGYILKTEVIIHQKDETALDKELMKEVTGKLYATLILTIKTRNIEGSFTEAIPAYIKPITSLSSSLVVFKAIKCLEESVLCQDILHPNIESYNIVPSIQTTVNFSENLNRMQEKVVVKAADLCLGNRPGMFLIQGQPGTGKTAVVISIIKEIIFSDNEQCILVLAPSSAAVDELVLRLIEIQSVLREVENCHKKLRLVGVGLDNSTNEHVKRFSLQNLTNSQMLQDLVNYCPAYRMERAKLMEKINSTKDEAESKKLRKELCSFVQNKLGKKYYERKRSAEKAIVLRANVICSTLNGCINSKIESIFKREPRGIKCCIIDEATQSSEIDTLIPLILGVEKLVLVGDPQLLPVTAMCNLVKEYGLEKSLFSRVVAVLRTCSHNPVDTLNVQYRMHPSICQYPNKAFYRGFISTDNSVVFAEIKFPILRPYYVFSFNETASFPQETTSESNNQLEIDCVIKILEAINAIIGDQECNIGIIAPENNQITVLNSSLAKNKMPTKWSITTNTVDGFQGQQRDIVILICIKSEKRRTDRQRLNVALTRSKGALYVVGADNLFMTTPMFYALKKDALQRRLFTNLQQDVNLSTIKKILVNH